MAAETVAGSFDCVLLMRGLPICRRFVGDVYDMWGCSDRQTESAILTPTRPIPLPFLLQTLHSIVRLQAKPCFSLHFFICVLLSGAG